MRRSLAICSSIRSGDGDRAAQVTADLVEKAWQTTRTLFLEST